jgi:hypothetical protein
MCEVQAEMNCKATGKAKIKFDTNNNVELSGETGKLYPGVKTVVTAKNAKYKGNWSKSVTGQQRQISADFSYKQDFISSQLVINSLVDTSFFDADLSATIGDSGLSVGAKYSFGMNYKDMAATAWPKIVPENVAVEYRLKDLVVTLLTSPGQEVKLGFMQQVNNKTTVGGEFHVPKDDGKAGPTFSVAASNKFSADTNVYGVFKSDGTVKATVEKSFAEPKVTAAITCETNISDGTAVKGPFGIKVSMGDN